jgi:ketosteroid isomerase-like protein
MHLFRTITTLLAATSFTCWLAAATPAASSVEQVYAAERAFARSMAERRLDQFTGFVSEEAVFLDGTTMLRGRQAVAEGWAAYFKGPNPPFSWEPDQVVVLESGTLALSTGPVRDPSGKVIARFNSIWRLESPGTWRVIFDKGSPPTPGP